MDIPVPVKKSVDTKGTQVLIPVWNRQVEKTDVETCPGRVVVTVVNVVISVNVAVTSVRVAVGISLHEVVILYYRQCFVIITSPLQ